MTEETAALEPLMMIKGAPPTTASGAVGCVMALASGRSSDTQWFDYRTSFFGDIVRIEWETETMAVVLPKTVAEGLFSRNYARPMSNSEAREYNKRLAVTPDETDPEPLSRNPEPKGDN